MAPRTPPGASGNLGSDAAAKAAPDGATIGVSIGEPNAIRASSFPIGAPMAMGAPMSVMLADRFFLVESSWSLLGRLVGIKPRQVAEIDVVRGPRAGRTSELTR